MIRITISTVVVASCISVGFGDLAPSGGEFLLTDRLIGEQMNSSVAIGSSGGYLVWQDNQVTDGEGLGISAKILDSSYSSDLAPIRINEYASGDQENAKVALLNNGGAVFAWQGGDQRSQDIYARFMGSQGTFSGAEMIVNSDRTSQKSHPQIAVLKNGDVIVVWISEGQDGSLNGIYGQLLSQEGVKIGEEFRVNQTTSYNQQFPTVAALADGGFVITWTTEVFRGLTYAVDFDLGLIPDNSSGAFDVKIFLLGRKYNSSGDPEGNEFGMISGDPLVSHPVVLALDEGGFGVAWSRLDVSQAGNSWDVFYQKFNSDGTSGSQKSVVNSYRQGDQLEPQVAVLGEDLFVSWTSLGQDGFGMGVFAQLIKNTGEKIGSEFQVNSTWQGNQSQPALASDGIRNVLAVWSGYVGGAASFDVLGQVFAISDNLLQPDPPFAIAVNQNLVNVSWPAAVGREIEQYELFIDQTAEPVVLTSNSFAHQPLLPSSTHTYRLAYRVSGGQRSPVSIASTGTTWGIDSNYDGLPDDWQSQGSTDGSLLKPDDDFDQDGASNRQEFLAGTDPRDSESVLRVTISTSGGSGLWFNWNTQPGSVYQIQVSSSLGENDSWENYGEPRFAPDSTDQISLSGSSGVSYFRVVKIK